MKILETVWREQYTYYKRYYDTEKRRSFIEASSHKTVWFEEDPNGDFKTLIEGTPLKIVSKKPSQENPYKISPETLTINEYYEKGHFLSIGKEYTPRVFFLDIETTAKADVNVKDAPEEIVLIQIYDNKTNTMLLIGSEEWDSEKYAKIYKEKYGINLLYIKRNSEAEIIEGFFKVIQNWKPLLVLAWNGLGFDYPYLFKRAVYNGLDTKNFSPFGRECSLKTKATKNKYDEDIYVFETPGVHYMDYKDIYQKFTYDPRRSYALDYIAEVELGEKKVQHDMYSTFDGFRTGDPDSYIIPDKEPDDEYDRKMYLLQKEYRENPSDEVLKKIHHLATDLFYHYGTIDTYLLKRLDDKLRLVEMMGFIANTMGITFKDTLGTIKPWGRYIELVCLKDKIILPPDNYDDEEVDDEFVGGFVSEPQRGIFDWVVSVDINSAYPNLSIRGFNMSPETYIPIEKHPKEIRDKLRELDFFNEDDEKRFDDYIEHPEKFKELSKLLEKHNVSLSVTGTLFTREFTGIVPKLVGEFYAKRKEYKSKMIQAEKELEENHDNLDEDQVKALESEIARNNVFQLGIKIIINSLFGALGNKYFRMFNLDIGKSITGNTRFYIRLLRKNIQKFMDRFTDEDVIIYGDTDSTDENTVIETKKYGKIRIGDYFDRIESELKEYEKEHFSKRVVDDYTYSVDSDLNLVESPIKYIVKHKVNKGFYKISSGGNSVIVTEDHSVMVLRDGELIEVTPDRIRESDQIVLEEI